MVPGDPQPIQTFLKQIPQWSQRQDDVEAQLRDLYALANKFGLYDAADMIRYSLLGEPKYLDDVKNQEKSLPA
jgi:hypothetical protein